MPERGCAPKPPVPVTATIICRDEVEKIRGALESVRFCDEVVVVDSGSTDGTVEVCRQFADRVVETSWPGYVAQQNFARTLGRNPWVLSIDADERVTPELAREIGSVLATEPTLDAFRISRHVHYLGRWIDHSGWYPEERTRLFRKDRATWKGVDPHYEVAVAGRVGRLRGEIVHYTYDDMADHVRTLNRFSSLLASEHRRRGRRFSWPVLLIRPVLEFLKKYVLKRGFLDGAPGFFVASFSAFYVFLKIAKLWEAERVAETRPWRDGA
jgi:glycosyltransferase involved in cell wall biosynthesis